MADWRTFRNGQISIDYIAGAFVFFGAIIILIASVLNTLPEFQNQHAVNELELASWGMSETMMRDPGYWQNGTSNGTDWHTADASDVQVLGLQTGDRSGLSVQKIQSLGDMDYVDVQDVMGIDRGFTAAFTELLHIDTYKRFNRSGSGGPGSSPSFITEPAYPSGTTDIVHYGTAEIRDAPYYFLLADSTGWYNNLWVSDTWDFTDSETTQYNMTTDNVVTLGDNAYPINIADTQIGDGNVVILQRRIGRVGTPPPSNAGNIIETTRFGVTETDTVITAVFQTWS